MFQSLIFRWERKPFEVPKESLVAIVYEYNRMIMELCRASYIVLELHTEEKLGKSTSHKGYLGY